MKSEQIEPGDDKALAVITVRMSVDLHKRLKKLAHRLETSLNLLCVEALEILCAEPPATDGTTGAAESNSAPAELPTRGTPYFDPDVTKPSRRKTA